MTITWGGSKMHMNDIYEVAAGTIPGRHHVGRGNLLVGKNNQDAYGIATNERYVVAIVFDGCSASQHSEVGAKLAAAVLPNIILGSNASTKELSTTAFWQSVKTEVLRVFDQFAQLIDDKDSYADVISQYLLFTILGAVITENGAVIFSIGDGAFSINGVTSVIPEYPGNAPPYLCYGLLGSNVNFQFESSPDPVETLWIGTDGSIELLNKQRLNVPGKSHKVGQISFNNHSLTPWLRQLNSEVVVLSSEDGEPVLKRHHGLLNDDTTIVVVSKRGKR